MHILIAETRKSVRSAIRLLLEQQTESYFIGEVGTVDELMEYITFNCPDVIILDWDLRELDASLISRLRNSCSHLILTVIDSDPLTKNKALLVGADHFISKNDPPERLVEVVLHANEMVVTKTVSED